MKRKVVMHGPATYTISLPSQWVKGQNISRGDDLDVIIDGNMLKITASETEIPLRRLEMDFRGLGKYTMNTLLASIHKSGYDEVQVCFDEPRTLEHVRDRLQTMLIGLEIIEQSDKRCLIRCVAKDGEKEYPAFLRQSFLVTKTMGEETSKIIENAFYDDIDDALKYEQNNNRLTTYCQRLLNRSTMSNEKRMYSYVIIWLLESICDDYKYILNFCRHNSPDVSDGTVEMSKEVNSIFNAYYRLYYEFNLKGVESIRKRQQETQQKLLNLINENKDSTAILVYLNTILQRIQDSLASTVGLNY